MFTGIIETIGTVRSYEKVSGDVRLKIESSELNWDDVALGDSIATNGICLTVVEKIESGFVADVSQETLSVTTLADWSKGKRVNLEKALMPQSRLGGHIVSGHVDGIGEVLNRAKDARSERFKFKLPSSLEKYVAQKGSITIDGTSLTVNEVGQGYFTVNIVPHTSRETVIGDYKEGTQVNLEVDIIARYLERLLLGKKDDADKAKESQLTASFLAENGYLK